ncbi:uncharacterized protein LOC121875738 [Homarus americanus]|uniref:uncharacterized protein LOC121875738 n=1 Tax=Homarus americanus TaxID=6706 RepID=UPI001C46D162|nr:uncharacterized protein LOC121875738 [Homarus americanus]
MTSLEVWTPIEEAVWQALPSMGPQWMGKSLTSDRGYMLMVTDGCGLWGENRGAKYIIDQAEVWAPCIEAGIREISSLVLTELTKLNVRAAWDGDRQSVVFSISSQLNDLSYRWEFELKRLTDKLFGHHWVTPMLVQVQHLSMRVKQLATEVEQKQRQLDELLPDVKSNTKSPVKNSKTTRNKDNLIESAIESVVVNGAWTVMQDHLIHYPLIMKHLTREQ